MPDEIPLPPDPDDQNEQRAEWARCAVRAFAAQTGQLTWPDGGRAQGAQIADQLTRAGAVEDLDEAVGDLLCDLMHLADREGLDFAGLVERALGNYTEETAGAG